MPSSARLASLDQFRGYTVAGMFLVNFVGGYHAALPAWGHHNTYCSYADTIMPQFFFAVGFAARLTSARRAQDASAAGAWFRTVRRLLGLVLVALVIYTVGPLAANWRELVDAGWSGVAEALRAGFKSTWFQTLMHIAVTSAWILPVIRRSVTVRLWFMLASAVLHVALSAWFYFDWIHAPPQSIDGGPLGFLTWSLPMLWGTIACDWMTAPSPAGGGDGNASRTGVAWLRLTLASCLLMAAGWGLSCLTRAYDVHDGQPPASERFPRNAASPVLPPWSRPAAASWRDYLAELPLVPPPGSRAEATWEAIREGGSPYRRWLLDPPPAPPREASFETRRWNYWMMSQRAGSVSYHLFGAGLSGLLFVVFYGLCDRLGLRVGVFRTLGSNALAAYVLHMWVQEAVTPFIPRDSPGWYLLAGFGVFFIVTYLVLRSLEKQGIFIKV